MSAAAQIGGLSLAMAHAQLVPWREQAPPIQLQEYRQRLARARELLRAQGADALLIGAGASLRYFTGCHGAPASAWWRCC